MPAIKRPLRQCNKARDTRTKRVAFSAATLYGSDHNRNAMRFGSGRRMAIRFKRQGLDLMRKHNGGDPGDMQFARDIGMDRVTVYRVLNGHADPGIKFINGVLNAYGAKRFNEFFEAIPDEAAS